MPETSNSPARSVRRPDAFWWPVALAVTVSACVGAPPRNDGTGTSSTQGAAKPVTHPVDASVGEEAGPKRALEAFLATAEKGDFEACYRELSGPLRERYTPARLAEDFQAVKGIALDKLARARSAMSASPHLEDGRAEFPISESKAVRLVLEAGAWKIAALE